VQSLPSPPPVLETPKQEPPDTPSSITEQKRLLEEKIKEELIKLEPEDTPIKPEPQEPSAQPVSSVYEAEEIKKFQDEFEAFKNPESNGFSEQEVSESELGKLLDQLEQFHCESISTMITKNQKFHKRVEKRRLNLNIDYQLEDDDLRMQIGSPNQEPIKTEVKVASYRLTALESPPPPPKPQAPREPAAKRSLSFDERPRTTSTSSTISNRSEDQEPEKFQFPANNSIYSKYPSFLATPYYPDPMTGLSGIFPNLTGIPSLAVPTTILPSPQINFAAVQSAIKFIGNSVSAPTTPVAGPLTPNLNLSLSATNSNVTTPNHQTPANQVGLGLGLSLGDTPTPGSEDDRYLKPHYPKIYTRTASSDPRLNPTLTVEKEKEPPAPKKKVGFYTITLNFHKKKTIFEN
jgi:hypothetical protein